MLSRFQRWGIGYSEVPSFMGGGGIACSPAHSSSEEVSSHVHRLVLEWNWRMACLPARREGGDIAYLLTRGVIGGGIPCLLARRWRGGIAYFLSRSRRGNGGIPLSPAGRRCGDHMFTFLAS